MGQPTLNQQHYRFQENTANCNASTSLLGTEDITASASLLLDTTYFLRVKISNTGNKTAVQSYKLQYQLNGAGYTDVSAASSVVQVVNGGDTDGDATTELLTNDGGTFTAGEYDESGVTGSHTLAAGPNETEFVWAIEFREANLATADKVEFRLVDGATAATLDNYNITPTFIAPFIASEVTASASPAFGTVNLEVGATGADISYVFFISPPADWQGEVHAQGFAATVSVVTPGNEYNATGLLGQVNVEGFAATAAVIYEPTVFGQLGQVNVEGFAADVDIIRTIAGPDSGDVNVEGFAATTTVLGKVDATSLLGQVNLEGFAPTTTVLGKVDATSLLGEATLEGFAATLTTDRVVTSLLGEINVDGFAGTAATQGVFTASPAVGYINASVGATGAAIDFVFFIAPPTPWFGTVNFQGSAATVDVGGAKTVTSLLGQINLEGFAAAAAFERTVTTLLGEVNLEGFAATVTAGTVATVVPAVGVVNVEGFAGSAQREVTARPQFGVVNFDGSISTVTVERTARPDKGEVHFEGFAGTVTRQGEATVTSVLGEIHLVGFAPTVSATVVSITPVEDRGGGSGGRFYDEMEARIRREDEEIIMFIQKWLREVA